MQLALIDNKNSKAVVPSYNEIILNLRFAGLISGLGIEKNTKYDNFKLSLKSLSTKLGTSYFTFLKKPFNYKI